MPASRHPAAKAIILEGPKRRTHEESALERRVNSRTSPPANSSKPARPQPAPWLPLLGSTARTVAARRDDRGVGLVARAALPLGHHLVQRAAEQMNLAFPTGGPAVYIHEGTRQAIQRRLEQVRRAPAMVSVTDNRHTMIHATRKDGVLRVRLHHMFLDAPADVVDALCRYLVFKDPQASATVSEFIDQQAPRIRCLPGRKLETAGTQHDLQAIFDDLNATYFDNEVDARLGWGTVGTGKTLAKRSSIKLGSYTARERLIRINPKLDQAFVPRYFVAFVIFHEMLHHVIPATHRNGRRCVHTRVFREREQGYKHYDRAIAWETANIDRLLR